MWLESQCQPLRHPLHYPELDMPLTGLHPARLKRSFNVPVDIRNIVALATQVSIRRLGFLFCLLHGSLVIRVSLGLKVTPIHAVQSTNVSKITYKFHSIIEQQSHHCSWFARSKVHTVLRVVSPHWSFIANPATTYINQSVTEGWSFPSSRKLAASPSARVDVKLDRFHAHNNESKNVQSTKMLYYLWGFPFCTEIHSFFNYFLFGIDV